MTIEFGGKKSLVLIKKVEIPGTEGRAGMVAIPDPERKVDVEKVIIIIIIIIITIIIISSNIVIIIIIAVVRGSEGKVASLCSTNFCSARQ